MTYHSVPLPPFYLARRATLLMYSPFARAAVLLPALTVLLCTSDMAVAQGTGFKSRSFVLDSPDPGSVFQAFLPPGTWSVGVSDGAWNPWGTSSSGCDVNGANCVNTGWVTYFNYAIDTGPWVESAFTGVWASADLAMKNTPPPVVLSVTDPSVLWLSIVDMPYYDNVGLMTVSVNEVMVAPEPPTLPLLAPGLVGVLGMARRRRG